MSKQTMGFQAEVKQLLKLVINSLYSHKDIFLRELISNSADACDKLRFEALSNDKLFEDDAQLKINISSDEKTLTIEDNGIGMNRDEIVDNIGTIAKSGTKSFFEQLTGDQKQDSNLIGQFGVGFYSAFIVAEKVTVESRRAGEDKDKGVRWQSQGEGDYTLEEISKPSRGTKVILDLRKDDLEFAENFRIKTLIQKYSEHIGIPIMLLEEVSSEDDKNKEKESVLEWQQINKATALWQLPRTSIKDEEYQEFYKTIAHDWENPMKWVHAKVEGNLEYTQLLYIPSHAPFDLYERERTQGIKLYVKRVFIMEDTEKLMPNYLRFVRGIIDSNDLPLNVSREILQSSKVIDQINKGSVKKVLTMLENMAKTEEYQKFWDTFGQVFKEGIVEDMNNKERISKLCRFSTSKGDEKQTVSLEQYVANMKEGQDKIYYITSESYKAAKNSPHLEMLNKKGIEVILLFERIDEWLVTHLNEFDGKPLQSVTRSELDIDKFSEEKDAKKKPETKVNKELIKKIKKSLGDKVEDIIISKRLTDSPACLVAGAGAMDINMQRMMKSMGQDVPESKRILEINPNHPLLKHLKKEKDETLFNDWSEVLLDQSVLAEGGHLSDPAAFTSKLNSLLLALAK